MKNTGDSASCLGEQAQLESPEIATVSNTKPEQSTEVIEASAEDEIQQLVKDECLSLEQGPFAPNELSLGLGLQKAECTNEEDSYSSKLKPSEPSQWALEQPALEDAGIAPETVSSANDNKANAAANNQSKPKGKWNKNKKAKKRLASAPRNALQKENDNQEVLPSDLEISAMPSKEKSQMDHDILMPTPRETESLPRPVYLPERFNESSIEPFKDSKEQTMTGIRTQYHYDTLPRGRPDFRNNAGGSLKVPKKRKGKYPALTSKTFEASPTGKFVPSQSRYAASGPMSTTDSGGASATSSITHAEASDPSRKSRLNPLATSFESPRKAAATAVGAETVPYSPRAASSRAGSEEKSLEKIPSPSRFKIIQRPATTHNSPSKVPQLRENFNRGLKGADNFEISTKQQENKPMEIQRNLSKDRHGQERENQKLANSNAASPRNGDGKTKAGLDTTNWPALPASRVRSATLQ